MQDILEIIHSYILYVFINITGCPSPGYYGENCFLPCPQNCQDRRCHITEGTCLSCIPGYKGAMCVQGNSFVLLIGRCKK